MEWHTAAVRSLIIVLLIAFVETSWVTIGQGGPLIIGNTTGFGGGPIQTYDMV